MSQNDIISTVMRPRSVALAERLLWLSAGICVLFAVLEMTRFLPVGIHGDAVTSNFISGAFLAFCAVKIGDGHLRA